MIEITKPEVPVRVRRRASPSIESGAAAAAREPGSAPEASTGLIQRVGPAVEVRPVRELRPNPRNARRHPKKQLRQVAASIQEFGFLVPVLIDDADTILAGHARVEAAKLLGLEEVPTLRASHLSEAQKCAFMLADNKLTENAAWDQETLAVELQFLTSLDIDFDAEITGFETAEIDLLIEGLDEADDDPADEIPNADPDGAPVSQAGDLWILGSHRLLCGDAREAAAFARLMDGGLARMVMTDPPFNLPIPGHVSGLGRIQHPDFAMAAGEMSGGEFTAFLETAFRHHAHHSFDGAIHFVFMDWRHLPEILRAGEAVYDELKQLCVWVKTNAGMGSFYSRTQ